MEDRGWARDALDSDLVSLLALRLFRLGGPQRCKSNEHGLGISRSNN